ncbi:MAG TPA: xanthine dehydrogenase family protein molybdopterin-binding subunit [Dehalococcoidia bacterium]|nr:xanthine dehydrogenase family protein molybdopterin-binding subunit [Dehalococcoidia bacterium]
MVGISGFKVIGRPAAQPEAAAKVTGGARYTLDVVAPGTLWAGALRSPHPSARILRIDAQRARQLPGVRAVLTSADIPGTRYGRRIFDMPLLATERVRFAGERVAVVAADDAATSEEALSLIDVEYELQPAVFDALRAMQPDAPRVHAALDYRGYVDEPPDVPNVYSSTTSIQGDPDAGFAASDSIVEHTFTTPSQHHAYLEPHSTTVQIDAEGRVHVWLCNKTPHTARQQLSALLGLPEERILMHLSHIGGDFGGKGSVMDAPLCYYLAKATAHPVRMAMDYFEELTAANPRHPSAITIRAGLKQDGRILAWHLTSVFNTGAYAAFLPSGRIGGGSIGPYEIENVRVDSSCVYTNCTPRGHMRAPGSPQATFAIESFMDIAAGSLQMDTIEFRLRNLPEGTKARETLEAAAKAAGWGRPRAQNVGLGVSFFSHGTGSGQANVTLRITDEGKAELTAAAPDTGTGAHTILQQIVAEELGLPLQDVMINCIDTDSTTPDSGVGGSRVSRVYGQATLAAASDMRERLISLAAKVLELPADELSMSQGRVIANAADSSGLNFSELARLAHEDAIGLAVSGSHEAPRGRPAGVAPGGEVSYCAQIAEVEVDLETGEPKLHRFVTAHDVGTILNPVAHEGQILGGVIQGLGYALMEELVYEDGRIVNPHFGAYKIPVIQDIPDIETVLVETPAGPVPYAGKAIGEVSNCPVAPAVANAIADAAGVRIGDLPLTAEKVYRALQSQGHG